MLFNYILDNDILFYGLYAGTACFLGLSFVNAWFNPFSENQTEIKSSTSDSGADTIRALTSSTVEPSPTLHYFTPDQLRSMMDLTTEGSIVETSWADKAVQTDNFNFQGITLNLNHSPISLDMDSLNLSSKLRIDLSSIDINNIEINPNELVQMNLLDSNVDLALTEAYIPIPELAVYSDHLVQYLTWC